MSDSRSARERWGRPEHTGERVVYAGCCGWPAGRFGQQVWSVVLTALGTVWLAHSLGLVSELWDDVLVPSILIAVGVWLWIEAAGLRSR